jgi:hypothetical protein
LQEQLTKSCWRADLSVMLLTVKGGEYRSPPTMRPKRSCRLLSRNLFDWGSEADYPVFVSSGYRTRPTEALGRVEIHSPRVNLDTLFRDIDSADRIRTACGRCREKSLLEDGKLLVHDLDKLPECQAGNCVHRNGSADRQRCAAGSHINIRKDVLKCADSKPFASIAQPPVKDSIWLPIH